MLGLCLPGMECWDGRDMRQWQGQGAMAANELSSPPGLGASKGGSGSLCAQSRRCRSPRREKWEPRFPSCGHRRCVTGMGAASRDNHGSYFRTSPVAARAPRIPFVLSVRDPPWGEVSAPKDASEPLTMPFGVPGPCGAIPACALAPGSLLLC